MEVSRLSLKERTTPRTVIAYIVGLFFVSIGSATSIRSNLGSGPAVSISYTATLILGINFGLTTFIWQCILLFFQFLILRKDFRISMLFQLLAGFLIGYFNNLGLVIVDLFPLPASIFHRLFYVALSSVIGGFGVWLYTSAGLINMPTEGLVKAVSDKSGITFHKVKILYDVICVVSSGVICLIRLHTTGSVGIGTVIIAFTLGAMVGVYRKKFRNVLERFMGMPAVI